MLSTDNTLFCAKEILMNRMILRLIALAIAGCASTPYQPPEVFAAGGIEYPAAARERMIDGYVKVAYDVKADGTAVERAYRRGRSAGRIDAAALAAVRTWRFKPAVDHGKV